MNFIIILTLLAATALGGGAVYASGDALPGDALYGIKTGAEEVQLALAGDAQDINLYNQFLAERALEIGELVETERFDDLAVAAQHYEQNLAAMVQTMLENPGVGDLLMDQVRLAQQDRLQTMTLLMEHTLGESQSRIGQLLNAEVQQLSPELGEPGHGPGEPGMGAGESQQSENQPGQGPGQPGGPEESQDDAAGQDQDQTQGGQSEAGAGAPQGNGEPGMGGNEPDGIAIPGQGEPGFGAGEPGSGDCVQGTVDCEPIGTGPSGQGSGQQNDPQMVHTPQPIEAGQTDSGPGSANGQDGGGSNSGNGQGGGSGSGNGQGGGGSGGNK